MIFLTIGFLIFILLPQSLLDLRLVKETRKFIKIIYKATELLLDTEKYGSTSQMRRAVV